MKDLYHTNSFESHMPFWHLFTNGNEMQVIFSTAYDYKLAVNLLAISACLHPGVIILTFVLMSNHIHLVLSGEKDSCLAMFDCFKAKLMRALHDNPINWKQFQPTLSEVRDEYYLKTVIAYVNRNPFVSIPSCTPFNYPWGAGKEFFKLKEEVSFPAKEFEELRLHEKRQILRTRIFDSSYDKLTFRGNTVETRSFCDIELAEKVFANAHDYMYWICRKVESFKEIARSLKDEILYTDEELGTVIFAMIKKRYNVLSIHKLTAIQKTDIAIDLNRDYNAGIPQLRRILNLDTKTLKKLFPEKI